MYSFQLKLKSLNKKSLYLYFSFLNSIFKKLSIPFSFINLPKKVKKITLIKSPHVYKKAREQFQIITYKSCHFIKINVYHLNFLKFLILNKPKTVNITLKKI